MSPKSPPDITVFDIANWFLMQAKGEVMPLTHMKLQKLVYFAYGWCTASIVITAIRCLPIVSLYGDAALLLKVCTKNSNILVTIRLKWRKFNLQI